MDKLFKTLENRTSKCNICGIEIKFNPNNYGIKSHARKHIREGKAREIHTQSTRCYAGYDIEFLIER